MYLLEQGAQPDRFASIPQAMYWAIVTLATVGYGDVVPVTDPGKIAAGVVIIAGLIFFALPIAIIATSFLAEIDLLVLDAADLLKLTEANPHVQAGLDAAIAARKAGGATPAPPP